MSYCLFWSEFSDNGYKVPVILDFVYTMIIVGWSLFADVYAGGSRCLPFLHIFLNLFLFFGQWICVH